MDSPEQHKIMAMEPDKRERLIKAAMHEFAVHDYKSANTDAIVREAGISKGLLFHYFGSKERLYEFLKEYAIGVLAKEYTGLMNLDNRDVIDAMWQAVLLKMDLSYKYPDIFDFMTTAYLGEDSGRITAAFDPVRENMFAKLLENADRSLFREGVDIEKAVNIVRWSIVGYSNSQMKCASSNIADYQQEYARYLDELGGYITMFKNMFYKEDLS
jgi:AcrR family transcriptional regulator